MVSGGAQTSQGSGATGQTSSLSFVPALLANAFFGTGIGLDKGGFQITGLGDFAAGGQIKGGRASSLIDPFGLQQVANTNRFNNFGNLLESRQNSFNTNPFLNITGKEGNKGLFSSAGNLGDFSDALFDALAPNRAFTDFTKVSPAGLGLFGEGEGGAGGAPTTAGILDPFDLVSNILDLVDPNINPGVAGGLQGLLSGQVGGLLGNELLFGSIGPTLQEGLATGFKPDLQPIINEASRAFFSDIVPQLGQSNVALQEGVGPFSTDLSAQLTNAGGALASQLGALEVENQNRAADRRGEFLGLSSLITDQLFNAGTDAGRNLLDLGEQLALQGTRGGRQSQLLSLLAGIQPSGAIQSSSSKNNSKGGNIGIF